MAAITRQRGEVYAPPRYDAYIVLLIISLIAMILGCALLWMDYSSYGDQKAPTVTQHQPAPPAAANQPPPAPPPQGKDAAPPAPGKQ